MNPDGEEKIRPGSTGAESFARFGCGPVEKQLEDAGLGGVSPPPSSVPVHLRRVSDLLERPDPRRWDSRRGDPRDQGGGATFLDRPSWRELIGGGGVSGGERDARVRGVLLS